MYQLVFAAVVHLTTIGRLDAAAPPPQEAFAVELVGDVVADPLPRSRLMALRRSRSSTNLRKNSSERTVRTVVVF